MQNQEFYLDVGSRIKRSRENKCLTQEALATLIDLSRATLANIESGRQKILLDKFVAISKALNVSIQDLLPSAHENITAEQINTKLSKNISDKELRNWIAQTIVSSQN